MENLLQCDGRRFRCKIRETPAEGRIRVENGNVYLCQNKHEGTEVKCRFGYKYSWSVLSGSKEYLAYNHISDFVLIPSTPDEIESYKDWQGGDKIRCDAGVASLTLGLYGEIIFRCGELVVAKFRDCASPNFTCDDLHRVGYRLDIEPLSEEEKTIEISMDEIAEKWGISKDQLRIKKE